MHPLDALEGERGGPFYLRAADGSEVELPSPASLPWSTVAAALIDLAAFVGLHPALAEVPIGAVEQVRGAWVTHFGLTDERGTRRLVWNMRRYATAIESDLMAFMPGAPSLLEMWQGRQWRRLLVAIDALPRHSAFAAAVAGDEEHAAMLVEAMAERGDDVGSKGYSPPLTHWTPEVERLANLEDLVKQLIVTTYMSNAKKGAQRPEMKPAARPQTATATIRDRVKRQRHEALAARMIPRRNKA